MNKITKEDLESIFKKIEHEEKVHISKSERVLVHKNFNQKQEEITLKKVRKKIHKLGLSKKRSNVYEGLLKFTLVAGFGGFILFVLINYQAYFSQLEWIYYVNYLGRSIPNTQIADSPTPTPSPSIKSNKNNLILPIITETKNKPQANEIIISKIGVLAPINWDVAEPDILESLKSGVAHYKGTSHPGDGGNIFLVGHSSNYFWIKSDYNQIFSLLDKLQSDDRIEIKYKTSTYIYKVIQNKVVSANEVEVLNNTPKELLTLMTCWPVGTSLNRLIIQAELVYVN